MKHLIPVTVGAGVALLTFTYPLDAQSVRVEAGFRSPDAELRIAYESRGSSWLRYAPGVGVDCGRCEPAYGHSGSRHHEEARSGPPGFRWKQLRWKQLKTLREHERERLKDLREAEREYLKDIAESHREWLKDQREREREFLKREREARRGPHQRGPRR